MKKLKNNIGMTLAEMLIVVAIIGVLGGVAFVSVWNYQRSMGQLERDGIAKEIFVAAQNHLTAAYGEGYLGLKEPASGSSDTNPFGTKADDGSYYFVVNGTGDAANATVFDQILPFGSVDETVRGGGSYIIHYQQETGLVLDVFYCTTHGSPTRFNHSFFDGDDFTTVMSKAGEENKSARRTYEAGGNSILGWYGGTGVAELPTIKLKAPTISVKNAEKLYVEVEDNPDNTTYFGQYTLKLIITGVDSKAQKAYELKFAGSEERVKSPGSGSYTVILDDVTTWGTIGGMHFGNIAADTTEKFIPGEDIEIQAVAYSTSALANIAYSSKYTTNSLFGSINTAKDTAYIGNIRHLENLDVDISSLDIKIDNSKANKINIAHAEQTDSFSWVDFQKAVKKIESKSTPGTESVDDYASSVCVYDFSGTNSGAGCYMPIEPDYALTYNGKSHSISDVAVDTTGDGGLFGSISSVTEIKNLELIDFSITGTTSAGALAGTLSGCTVTNVLARNKDNSTTSLAKTITGATAGGLIGTTESGTTLQYSAAAVIVNGSTTAGGLIGSASGPITGCYSGGHTQSGSYEEWVKTHPYDVTGGTVGGLVGTSSAAINDSYSTCSVSGTTAGGFAGSASGSISNCYATGLVDGTTKYAFLGSGGASLSGNYYYRVINEVPSTKANAKEGDKEPMEPYPSAGEVSSHLSSVKPIDLNADSYNKFVGAWDDWNPARAYDSSLVQYYSGSYTLRTVDELNSAVPTGYENWNQLFVKTHYGDWPSPEVFFINE
jgi:prepilin-type N-terminal cleavage/methylation domain